MKSFAERLAEKRVVIVDGAMGTMLYSLGVPKGHCYDELNLSNPSLVASVHKAYAEAGAEIIETNTFGANRAILEKYYDLGSKTFDINYQGARIAREACPDCIVAGSVGPNTRPLESRDKPSPSEQSAIFFEQMNALVEGGADIIILETMSNLNEALIGFEAAQKVKKDLPVIVSFSFSADGRTVTGFDSATVSKALRKAGVKIIGANCSSGPQAVYGAIQKMTAFAPGYLSAMPNAGLPRFEQGRLIYPHNPDYFAYYAERFARLGVALIGGCCGTTPEHIAAIARAVKGLTVRKPKGKPVSHSDGRQHRSCKVITTPFKVQAEKKFVVIVEMDTPKGTKLDKELAVAKELREAGADAVSISDSPMARVRMSPLPLAYRAKQEVGVEVILHITCRDRNILGLQADLLAISALGIDNVLALTGDPPSAGDYPFAVAVYELNALGLVEIAQKLNRGEDGLGNPLSSNSRFWIGIGANGTPADLDRELAGIKKKLKAGAGFIITQPVFDLEKFSVFLKTVKKFKVPVFAGVLPLTSHHQAEYLHNEVPGITIPKAIRERMKQKDSGEEGISIGREIISQLRNLVNGICIMPPLGRYQSVKELLR
jgi:homocysteine S-methyltransferase